MTFLDEKTLDEIGKRVFMERSSTLEDEGRAVDRKTLIDTVLHVRQRMRSTLDSLSDSAFDAQPDDSEGNEVWSAGQIASHICVSQSNVTGELAKLVNLGFEPDTSGLGPMAVLDRADSAAMLDRATDVLEKTLHAIPEDDDLTKTLTHERFGTLGVRGWLTLVAVHEKDHVRQLQSLDQG